MPLPRPERRPRPSLAPFVALPTLALAACGGDPLGPNLLTDGSTITSGAARAYVDTALAIEEQVFYWHDRVDFARQQNAIQGLAAAARTRGQVWGAVDASIDPWLRDAGDDHSAFFRPEESPGVVDAPAGDARFLVSGAPLGAGGPALAYLWLPTYTGINAVGRADSTQAVIRTLDQNSPCGWVLDLRFNPGGTWAAMLAGINPIFGDAPASRTLSGLGGFVDRDNARALFYVQGGEAGVFDPSANRASPQVKATTSYALRRPNSPVAVLTGPLTASAGELITLGFRGGAAPVRSFGEPTYGLTTTPFGHHFADDGYINITGGIMFDRTGTLYGSTLQPDEPVSGPPCLPRNQGGCAVAVQLFGADFKRTTPTPSVENDATLRAATTWLRQQPACTNAPAAQRGPALSRAAAAADLPGEVRPGDGARRVSRYFVPRGGGALVER